MVAERRVRLLTRLLQGVTDIDTARLCQVGAEVTGTDGAGIMLMSGDVQRGSIASSDGVSAEIEQWQYALGEGPCLDAYHQLGPALEPDLAHPAALRWPGFTGPALDAGVRAIFGFPLRLGEVCLGALDLYRLRPGPLSTEQHADALALADLTTRVVLDMQAEAALGEVAPGIVRGADFGYVVHQASGMVAAQLEVTVAHALIRLRAYSFGNDRPLREVAKDIVERRLRFDRRDHLPYGGGEQQ